MTEERKLVTVLFADIVGSSATGEESDPEVVRETMRATFATMRDVLAAHGGHVEKFSGDDVMAVFGIPSVHDDDADRAVRASFALRDAVPQALRIGVNSGEVVASAGGEREFMVTGAPVNAAKRIQQAASPGEILVGSLTRELTRGGVRYAAVRPLDAKGTGTIQVSTAEALTSAVPEQHRGLGEMRAPLVGRDRELALLLDAYERLKDEQRGYLLTVFGPAGSGKSRLADEFVARVGADRVRRGRCLPYGEGITYYAVQLMLRADARIDTADSRDVAVEKLRQAVLAALGDGSADAAAVAARLLVLTGLGNARELMPDTADEAIADELRWGVRRYFERRAASGPLVLVFEDIHWAEAGLLELIEHLADWSRAPILVLCLARPELLETRREWGGGRTNAAAVSLSPLSPDDTRTLIAELLAIDALPEALRADLVQRAEGNPLFVEEFLRMLMETGAVERREGRWVGTAAAAHLSIPPSLHGLIAARLDRTPPEVKALLQRGAVMGRIFWTNALATLAGGAVPSADALREAARRDLIVETDDRSPGRGRLYRFKHVLVRDVAYASLPKSERARLHDAYARWLEDVVGDRREDFVEIIAHHADQAYSLARELGAASAADLGRRAFDRVMAAATKARGRWDVPASAALYERAEAISREIDVSPAERAEAHGFAVLQRFNVGGAAPVRMIAAAGLFDETIRAAREAGPSEVLVRLLVMQAHGMYLVERSAESLEMFSEALSIAREIGDRDLIGYALFCQSLPLEDDLVAERQALREALAYLRQNDVQANRARCLAALSRNHLDAGEFTAAKALSDEAIAAARQSSSKRDLSEALLSAVFVADAIGDHDAALVPLADISRVRAEMGVMDWLGRLMSAFQLRNGGRAESALAMLDAVGDLPAAFPGARANALALRAELAAERGEVEDALRHAAEAQAIAEKIPGRTRGPLINALSAEAVAREAGGDAATAEAFYRRAFELSARTWPSPLSGVFDRTRRRLAELLIRHGRGTEAAELLEPLRDFYADPLAQAMRAWMDELLRAARGEVALPSFGLDVTPRARQAPPPPVHAK